MKFPMDLLIGVQCMPAYRSSSVGDSGGDAIALLVTGDCTSSTKSSLVDLLTTSLRLRRMRSRASCESETPTSLSEPNDSMSSACERIFVLKTSQRKPSSSSSYLVASDSRPFVGDWDKTSIKRVDERGEGGDDTASGDGRGEGGDDTTGVNGRGDRCDDDTVSDVSESVS